MPDFRETHVEVWCQNLKIGNWWAINPMLSWKVRTSVYTFLTQMTLSYIEHPKKFKIRYNFDTFWDTPLTLGPPPPKF